MSGDVQGWQPTHERQHPPFEAGNRVAQRHGAYSARVVGPVAERLVEAVMSDPDVSYLHQPSYAVAVAAWAAAEARVIVLADWVDGMELAAAADSGRGKTSVLELLRQWEATALTHRSRLGLDPLSRARLGRDVAATQVDLVGLLTELREREEGQG